MSSPMHSLKKSKIPLFPGHMSGHRPIPFRHPEYSEDESRLLEEVTALMVEEKKRRDPFVGLPQINPANQINLATGVRSNNGTPREGSIGNVDGYSDPPSDQDLMRMMMNKLAFLEQQVTTQKEELRVKDRRIKVLEDKLQIVGGVKGEGQDGSRVRADLEKHCLLLQQQVHEMETFLAEYGMVWVGEDDNDGDGDVYINASVQVNDDFEDDIDNDIENNNSTDNDLTRKKRTMGNPQGGGTWKHEDSFIAGDNNNMTAKTAGLNVDFDLLVENIKDLNVLAGEGVAQIKKTADGARFQIPDSVQLTLYANGILLFNGPFRPYSDPRTRHCVQDLMDGYFPSELQKRFPDGVPFQLTDLRGVTYQAERIPNAFAGEGQTLGGEVKPSRLVPSKYHDHVSWSDNGNKNERGHLPSPLTKSQFLGKLPKSVIKDGKVIDVRNSVSDTLTGNSTQTGDRPKSNITLLSTRVTKEMSESVANAAASTNTTTTNDNNRKVTSNTNTNTNTTRDNSTNLRPKSYTGCHKDVTTLRVVTETGDHTYVVKMKFQETIGNLRSYLDSHRRPKVPYDIVSTFPHKVHKNNSMTLQDAGLTPNAVLHLKPVT